MVHIFSSMSDYTIGSKVSLLTRHLKAFKDLTQIEEEEWRAERKQFQNEIEQLKKSQTQRIVCTQCQITLIQNTELRTELNALKTETSRFDNTHSPKFAFFECAKCKTV